MSEGQGGKAAAGAAGVIGMALLAIVKVGDNCASAGLRGASRLGDDALVAASHGADDVLRGGSLGTEAIDDSLLRSALLADEAAHPRLGELVEPGADILLDGAELLASLDIEVIHSEDLAEGSVGEAGRHAFPLRATTRDVNFRFYEGEPRFLEGERPRVFFTRLLEEGRVGTAEGEHPIAIVDLHRAGAAAGVPVLVAACPAFCMTPRISEAPLLPFLREALPDAQLSWVEAAEGEMPRVVIAAGKERF